MTREEAIRKMEFCKNAYQKLIDEEVDNGTFVGTGVNGVWKADTPLTKAYSDMVDACDMAINALEQEPKTGKWIEEDIFDGDVAYRCSVCNELFCLMEGTPKDNEYNYCPNCGAKMEVSE